MRVWGAGGGWETGDALSVQYLIQNGQVSMDEVGPCVLSFSSVAASLGLILFLPMLPLHWPYHFKKKSVLKSYDLNTFP